MNKENFKHSLEVGFSFGLTSGVITTLGLMVGLYSGTRSLPVVISGIIIIAFADSLSDAFGIHISEETENVHSEKEIWMSTFFTFISKLFCTLSFIIPFLFISVQMAIITGIIWGLLLLSGFSYFLAINQKKNPMKVIAEHLLVAVIVIAATYFLGEWINYFFFR